VGDASIIATYSVYKTLKTVLLLHNIQVGQGKTSLGKFEEANNAERLIKVFSLGRGVGIIFFVQSMLLKEKYWMNSMINYTVQN
jgi:uncharacterized membrane protein